jgi:hypothetical protein
MHCVNHEPCTWTRAASAPSPRGRRPPARGNNRQTPTDLRPPNRTPAWEARLPPRCLYSRVLVPTTVRDGRAGGALAPFFSLAVLLPKPLRHQIESPKRCPKESAQGRMAVNSRTPGFQKFVRLSVSFRQSETPDGDGNAAARRQAASPNSALGGSSVPQCRSGP